MLSRTPVERRNPLMMGFARVALLLALLFPATGLAEATASSAREVRARELFEAGAAAFAAQDYEAARRNFEQAYALSERKRLLFNIGLTADRQGDETAALRAYEQYLEFEPRGDGADKARERVRSLRAGRLEPKAVARAAMSQSDGGPGARAALPTSDASPLYKRWWLWAGVGALVVAAVVVGATVSDGHAKTRELPPTSTGLTIRALRTEE